MLAQKKRSRTVIGFHRLGLVLATPLLLAAAVVTIFVCFSNNGPVVPDPSSQNPSRVVLATQSSSNVNEMSTNELVAAHGRTLIRNGAIEKIATIEVDTGPIRTFEFYWPDPRLKSAADEKTIQAVLTDITSFERRRGAVISANEQPALVGDLMVREAGDRRQPYNSWTHLKRAFNWEGLLPPLGLVGLALVLYVVARALGWVIDGFVSKPEG